MKRQKQNITLWISQVDSTLKVCFTPVVNGYPLYHKDRFHAPTKASSERLQRFLNHHTPSFVGINTYGVNVFYDFKRHPDRPLPLAQAMRLVA